MNRKKVELLAPAGGMRQVIAAVENGADAVYMGGSSFNARIGADNFTDEKMREAIEYAHLRNVKVYITMNTLYTDEEVLEAAECAGRYYAMGADALIIQDLGFGEYVRNLYPDFELHLSTQATVCDRRGVKKASELGYSRVVPARELTLDEIRDICSTDTEIEVFVHGALCMCYSGQCQLSRRIGGRSGNRGLCAQPCRLSYALDGKEGYHLSTKDLCQLERIPDLIDAGVASFKIEGRMKSPEYVSVVVSIYRKYIDMYYENGYMEVSEEDMNALTQVFSRSGFTNGYIDGYPKKMLLSGSIPKHSGIYIGKALSSPDSFGVLDVRLEGSLEMGDGVEIRGKNTAGNVVTFIKEKKNGITSIGDIKGDVRKGDSVYRTSSISQLKEARKTFEEGRFIRKTPVSMEFQAEIGKQPVLKISEGDSQLSVSGDFVCERAERRSLDQAAVKKQLSKLGATPYEIDEIHVSLEEGLALPVSVINAMRRDACDALSEVKKRGREPVPFEERGYEPVTVDTSGIFMTDFRDIERLEPTDAKVFIPVREYLENELPEGYSFVPYIPLVSKGSMDSYVEVNAERIAEMTDEIMVNSLGWLDEFTSRGLTVYAGPGLNVYNGYTDELLRRMGASACADSFEVLDDSDGSAILMITEFDIGGSTLTDRKGTGYEVFRDEFSEKTYIIKRNVPDMEKLLRATERLNLVYI